MSLISSAELTFVYLYLGFEKIKIKKKWTNKKRVRSHSTFTYWFLVYHSYSNWNLVLLVFERGKTGQPKEKPLGAKEQQQIQTPLISLPPPTNYKPIYLLTKKNVRFYVPSLACTEMNSIYFAILKLNKKTSKYKTHFDQH